MNLPVTTGANPYNLKRLGVIVMVPLYSSSAATFTAPRRTFDQTIIDGLVENLVHLFLLSIARIPRTMAFPPPVSLVASAVLGNALVAVKPIAVITSRLAAKDTFTTRLLTYLAASLARDRLFLATRSFHALKPSHIQRQGPIRTYPAPVLNASWSICLVAACNSARCSHSKRRNTLLIA
jgi:hypothetical protein